METPTEKTTEKTDRKLLNKDELLKLAEKFNSGGRYGQLKEIHNALLRYNLYLQGKIKKENL